MPVGNEFLIAPHIGRIDPFTDLHFALTRRRALMYLQKILKRVILIESSQRKDAADSGPYGMDAARFGRITPSTTFSSREDFNNSSQDFCSPVQSLWVSMGSKTIEFPMPRQQDEHPLQPLHPVFAMSLLLYSLPSETLSRSISSNTFSILV